MQRLVAFGRCFSDPLTIRMMVCLLERPMTVGEFRHMLSEEPSVINARLQRLRQAELIETHFDRRRLMISLAPRAVPIVSRLLGDFYDDISWDPDITDDLNRMQSKRVIKSLEEMYHFSEA